MFTGGRWVQNDPVLVPGFPKGVKGESKFYPLKISEVFVNQSNNFCREK